MGNVFEGDEQYLINARKAVTDLEDAKDELDTLKGNLKKMQRMVWITLINVLFPSLNAMMTQRQLPIRSKPHFLT